MITEEEVWLRTALEHYKPKDQDTVAQLQNRIRLACTVADAFVAEFNSRFSQLAKEEAYLVNGIRECCNCGKDMTGQSRIRIGLKVYCSNECCPKENG